MKSHYEILGIRPDASSEEIKRAYFELAKKYHPDSGDSSEVEKFHKVAEAYKVLSSQEERKAYDDTQSARVGEGASSSSPNSTTSYRAKSREAYRDEELRDFHKHKFQRAILRVLAFSVVLAMIGMPLSVVLGGRTLWGALAGFGVGLSLSVNKNFDMRSYFSDRRHKIFVMVTWVLILIGFGYFASLIARDLIPL